MSNLKKSISTFIVPTIDPVELASKLAIISSQAQTLPVISSDDDYNLAYEIRAKIKSAIKFIHSKTKPNIKRWNDGHKASLAEERELIKPFNDLDSQLDSMMLEWNRKKKELEEQTRLERDRNLTEIYEAILLEDGSETFSSIYNEIREIGLESNKQISAVNLSSLLPEFIPEKSRGERTHKRIKICDPSKFNPDFIIFLLSDVDIQETVCTWLRKQSKLLGGFESLVSLAGEGSIEQVEEETISIR